ncbi:Outer membrane protein A [Daphnia sinensis]|uniref:Outer membrane protein A n=1 Tax=Daphnia sinensis TaxID=1820382 RepID=A0AAD5KT16_9CRUS|nr:Outer membrane protein A [Daphnia sinensis]
MTAVKIKPQRFLSNFLMVFLLFAPLVQAQTSLETGQAGNNARIDVLGSVFEPQGGLGASQSRLVVYRTAKGNPLPGATGVFVHGQYHTSLVPGGYSMLCLAPGSVEVGARQFRVGRNAKDNQDSVTALQLPSAQTQYLSVTEESGRPVMKPVPAAQALQELSATRLQIHTVSRVTKAQECVAGAVPAPAPEQYSLSGDTLFAFGKSDRAGLTSGGLASLDSLMGRIRSEYSRIDRVHVIGHADPLGSVSANERLSVERADTVRHYMQITGQISAPFSSEGRGSRQLAKTGCASAVSARSIACNQPNRRVVIEVSGQRR